MPPLNFASVSLSSPEAENEESAEIVSARLASNHGFFI
jgi:hypothetical protein